MRRASTIIPAALVAVWIGLINVSAGAQNPGGSEEGKKLKNPVASSPDSIKAGQAAYQKNCRFCHGNDAKGNGPMAPEGTHPPDLEPKCSSRCRALIALCVLIPCQDVIWLNRAAAAASSAVNPRWR